MRRFAVRFVLPVLLAFAFATPTHALDPGDFFSLLRNALRFLWANEGSSLDPSGRPAPGPSEGSRWIWESTGSSIDPNGEPVSVPSGFGWLWAEEGSSLYPNGRPSSNAPRPFCAGCGSDR